MAKSKKSKLKARAKKAAGTKKKAVAKVRKRVQKKAQAQKKLQYLCWKAVEVEEVNPLFDRQMITGQNVMFARLVLRKGCIVPLHNHHNEQITFVTEGALKFEIDGQEIVVRAGEVLAIPPNMPHRVEALEDTVDFDIFDPPREDWINKTDQYLRRVK
jgi:quercetin dioxygenase-like cupin family protein